MYLCAQFGCSTNDCVEGDGRQRNFMRFHVL